ncbi:exonuclease [Pseudorhizobium endolithicum]|uniref:Exonuclease n=1 Tax=Pseudorhizobium endolithicum TaxID=1191678 RepID=A0ABN7JJJ0_9HYPH|nr:3'-5' exoribonuclease [Pseudorhizobium endolithicum]CAD7034407.1 exonuclease [Pseudorhizobium endolithicum]
MNYISPDLGRLSASIGLLGLQDIEDQVDVYFSADVETDGPIPGPFSILSFAIVYAGHFDGKTFSRPDSYNQTFYREVKPISEEYQDEALAINGLDREDLKIRGKDPKEAMVAAYEWVQQITGKHKPVLVAYPLSFDWTWLYWYFTRFCPKGSPFGYSQCFDIKTAVAVKGSLPISQSSRSKLPPNLIPSRPHTHHALDDAIEQAEIFANVFEWER